MDKTAIICLDCGKTVEGKGSPKEVAKSFGWKHVIKGKWRCSDCQIFQSQMNEQFGAEAAVIIPSRG